MFLGTFQYLFDALHRLLKYHVSKSIGENTDTIAKTSMSIGKCVWTFRDGIQRHLSNVLHKNYICMYDLWVHHTPLFSRVSSDEHTLRSHSSLKFPGTLILENGMAHFIRIGFDVMKILFSVTSSVSRTTWFKISYFCSLFSTTYQLEMCDGWKARKSTFISKNQVKLNWS